MKVWFISNDNYYMAFSVGSISMDFQEIKNPLRSGFLIGRVTISLYL